MRRVGFARGEGGQAVVLLGLALTGMLVATGVAIDAGLEYVERRHEQVAADAAAFAAAVSMVNNWSAGDRSALARTAALDYAARNGYDGNGTTNSVTVNIPPQSGAHSGNTDYAEVIVSVDVKTTFIRILGSSFQSRTVQARAVGGIVSPPKNYAIIALAKTGSPTFTLTGNAEVEAENAGILVNSSGAPALSTTSNTQIEASVDVVGTASASGSITGTLTTAAAQQADPLAYLVAPTGAGMTAYPAVNATNGTTTLQPGIYPSISASGNAVVQLTAGDYVIAGGGIGVSGNARIRDLSAGNGVFIYNACANFPSSGGACGAISVSGNGRFELEKRSSGTYAGISIWQPCANPEAMSVVGGGQKGDDSNGELETSGSVYLPCAAVNVSGHGEVEVEESGQLIASTISAVGNGEIEVEWDAGSGTANRTPALVE